MNVVATWQQAAKLLNNRTFTGDGATDGMVWLKRAGWIVSGQLPRGNFACSDRAASAAIL